MWLLRPPSITGCLCFVLALCLLCVGLVALGPPPPETCEQAGAVLLQKDFVHSRLVPAELQQTGVVLQGERALQQAALQASYAAWREFAKRGPSQTEQGKLPPMCFSDLDESDTLWSNMAAGHDSGHRVAEFALRNLTNLERFHAIRAVLAATKSMFDSMGIESFLVFGTALGQARCADVIPWDVDCDVAIAMKDVEQLQAGALISDPRYELQVKNKVTPFGLVDTHTGYFCDIFQVAAENNYILAGLAESLDQKHVVQAATELDALNNHSLGSALAAEHDGEREEEDPDGRTLLIPYPYGPQAITTAVACPQFPDWGNRTMSCLQLHQEDIYPLTACGIDGAMYSCAREQDVLLSMVYGDHFLTPNHNIAVGL